MTTRKNKNITVTSVTGYEIPEDAWVIIDDSSAYGGVSYRQENETERVIGNGVKREWHAIKRVDHDDIVRQADRLKQEARNVLRSQCAKTPLGYLAIGEDEKDRLFSGWTDDAGIWHRGIDAIAADAEQLNTYAAHMGSERRVVIAAIAMQVRVDNEAAAKAIARRVVRACEEMATALREGATGQAFQKILQRHKNLDRLAVGMQRDAIIMALNCVKTARAALTAATKGVTDPDVKAKRLADATAKLDLSDLDLCRGMYAGEQSFLGDVDWSDEGVA